MWDAMRRLLARMTRVLPFVGFGRTPEPPTEPIEREEHGLPAKAVPGPHDGRHVNALEGQQRGGKHPQR